MATLSLRGQTVHTIGELPELGSAAPDFKLVNAKLQDKTLADYAGKKLLLNIVPSLDTPVCAKSAKAFNRLAEGRDDVVMLIISSDLPFAQSRFCGMEGLKHVEPLSLMRSRKFAKDYGVLLIDGPLAGITARAVVVIDTEGKVAHAEMVQDVADEPDYDAAMRCL